MDEIDEKFVVYAFQAAVFFEQLRVSGEWDDFFIFAVSECADDVCHGANALKFGAVDVAAAWVWFQQPKRFCQLAREWEERKNQKSLPTKKHPGDFENHPTDEQMEYFKRGGK